MRKKLLDQLVALKVAPCRRSLIPVIYLCLSIHYFYLFNAPSFSDERETNEVIHPISRTITFPNWHAVLRV